MAGNLVSEANKMMAFLKKEEAFCKKALQYMQQENMRLQIEELELRAAIRLEEMKIESLNAEEQNDPNMVASASSSSQINVPNSIRSPENTNSDTAYSGQGCEYAQKIPEIRSLETETVSSSITDDRYLEPLALNVTGIKRELMEFDN